MSVNIIIKLKLFKWWHCLSSPPASEQGWDVAEAVALAVLKDLVPVLEDEGGQEGERVVENVAERHPEGVDDETYDPGGLDETLYFVLYTYI